jgi:hypothetical protein
LSSTFFSKSASFAARVPSGITIEEDDTSEDEDFGASLDEDLESSFVEDEDLSVDFYGR